MTESDDDKWLEALAGRGKLDDEQQQALLDVLRASITEQQRDEESLEKLLQRLDAEGLLDEAESNIVPITRPRPGKTPTATPDEGIAPIRSPTQPRWLALAASLTVLGVAGLVGYQVYQVNGDPPWLIDQTVRGSTAPVEVRVENPRQASARLVDDLAALGIEAQRYRYRGQWIVDASVLGPEVTPVASVLGGYNVAVPPHGRVLLAFDTP